jgi:hypothetical protein
MRECELEVVQSRRSASAGYVGAMFVPEDLIGKQEEHASEHRSNNYQAVSICGSLLSNSSNLI